MSTDNKKPAIMEIKDLFVSYHGSELLKPLKAVDNVSIVLYKGETLGLVGESGCGKSTLGFSILNLLRNGDINAGNIFFKIGESVIDIANLNEYQMNVIRGNSVSMIFQAAQDCLNPLQTINSHLEDTLDAHNIPMKLRKGLIQDIFSELEIPLSRLNDYPFQFSGGMQQRIAIALALILNPDVVIADEPTTALDVLVQAKILNMLKKLKIEKGLSMIFISHDLGVIADISSRVAVMYAGEIVEIGKTDIIFNNPEHPYTQGLIKAVPNVKQDVNEIRSIPGSPPDLRDPPTGCKFHPRCEFAKKICLEIHPDLRKIKMSESHFARCHKTDPNFEFEEEI